MLVWSARCHSSRAHNLPAARPTHGPDIPLRCGQTLHKTACWQRVLVSRNTGSTQLRKCTSRLEGRRTAMDLASPEWAIFLAYSGLGAVAVGPRECLARMTSKRLSPWTSAEKAEALASQSKGITQAAFLRLCRDAFIGGPDGERPGASCR